MHLALVAATAILAASASQAEARARFKFRSSAPTLPASPTPVQAKAKPGGGFLPGAVIGASIGSRPAQSRENVTTGSTAPVGAAMPLPAAAAKAEGMPAKPVFVCASDRKVGAGSGFCEVN